jgi:hydroxypyruvate isomerase
MKYPVIFERVAAEVAAGRLNKEAAFELYKKAEDMFEQQLAQAVPPAHLQNLPAPDESAGEEEIELSEEQISELAQQIAEALQAEEVEAAMTGGLPPEHEVVKSSGMLDPDYIEGFVKSAAESGFPVDHAVVVYKQALHEAYGVAQNFLTESGINSPRPSQGLAVKG